MSWGHLTAPQSQKKRPLPIQLFCLSGSILWISELGYHDVVCSCIAWMLEICTFHYERHGHGRSTPVKTLGPQPEFAYWKHRVPDNRDLGEQHGTHSGGSDREKEAALRTGQTPHYTIKTIPSYDYMIFNNVNQRWIDFLNKFLM